MGIAPLALKQTYWEEFEVLENDLEFLYNLLLEKETPLTPSELVRILVEERIRSEKSALANQQSAAGPVYLPKALYEVGQFVQFPQLDWQRGQVVAIRDGFNPDIPPFQVIDVQFPSGDKHSFAGGMANHRLNAPLAVNLDDPLLDLKYVMGHYGDRLTRVLTDHLEENPDLVRIAGRWFPRALLVDIHIGHLNLAEAVLEMSDGGPLTARTLMEQLELPKDVNPKLTEFSLNLALQEDGRFDEVGSAGNVLWYLRRLEPDAVKELPVFLRCPPYDYDPLAVQDLLSQFEGQVTDELENCFSPEATGNQVTIPLLYPHFRAGTLPICDQLIRFFPTAYESPRVQFTFVDGDTGEKFSGWVVREHRYAFGLRDWYLKNGLITGSLVTIIRSQVPGEVILRSGHKRPARDWVRTAVVGSDGGIVFAMLKHALSTSYDERMAIVVSDYEALDRLWEQSGRQRGTLPQTVKTMMFELGKLSPQGHVHAQELYAAVNVIRRSPPGPILSILLENSWAAHLGDLYFRLDDSVKPEG
jgi:hypothetical protein